LDDKNDARGDHFASILAELETQLGRIDTLGAHIAGAHLDAAIGQLRLDRAKCIEPDAIPDGKTEPKGT
jgi:hypothetical protein